MYITQVAPTVRPVHQVNATGPQINETIRQWTEYHRTFNITQEVGQELRIQVIASTPAAYLQRNYSATLVWENIKILEILTILWNDCGTITATELDQNLLCIESQWTPPTPIVTLFVQLEESIVLSISVNDEINKSHAICTGFTIITKNRFFSEASRTWCTQDRVYHTMAHFQRNFIAAERDQVLTATTESTGYHGANIAEGYYQNNTSTTTNPSFATAVSTEVACLMANSTIS